ncbi:helix-turn-helix domain-containing protein [Flavobacterium alkalisoli]|uniref:AraC family transcriptional regulator n=1 Tax=Flavobacterium alkalisoli TaxID=2602769 RepID=UPI003A8EA3B4
MQQLKRGEFFGLTNNTIELNGLTLTDTIYTHDRVDWHYHENAYFTFILQDIVIEGNKNEIYKCTPGTLLLHNWEEPHYNIKPEGYTRGFHIEIERDWLEINGISESIERGSINISDPESKLNMYKIFRASKTDYALDISIQSLLLQIFSGIQQGNMKIYQRKPNWVDRIDEILRSDLTGCVSLEYLSKMVDIHPVHLSRYFPKYFHCGIGEYIKKLRVEKALSLMVMKNKTLSEIAYECGFSDQSHFIRCFKEITEVNPLAYRNVLLK